MDYQDINARTIDLWVENGWEWGTPVSHDVYERAKDGEWEVLLTPVRPVPHAWFGTLEGKTVLELACGGDSSPPVSGLQMFTEIPMDAEIFMNIIFRRSGRPEP